MIILVITIVLTVFVLGFGINLFRTRPKRTDQQYVSLDSDLGDFFFEHDQIFFIMTIFYLIFISGFTLFFWAMTLVNFGVLTEISRDSILELIKSLTYYS